MITYSAGRYHQWWAGVVAANPDRRIAGASNFCVTVLTSSPRPLPTLGGTAAVPSTVDVYVKTTSGRFRKEVSSGPFSVSNVPLISGAGTAELVIRDAAGHETRSSVPFYAASTLLAPDFTSWSVEGGLPRLSYGSSSMSTLSHR